MARLLSVSLLAGLLAAAVAHAEDPSPGPTPEELVGPPRAVALSGSTPVAIVVGTPVQFQDTSTGGPTFWFWDFSFDGAQPVIDSTAQNPVWTFEQTGVWPVRLEVCNATECSAAATQDVTVVEPCTFADDLVLPDLLGPILGLLQYDACHVITANGPVNVLGTGEVRLRAGRTIVLGDGFSAGGGGSFVAEVDFRLNTH